METLWTQIEDFQRVTLEWLTSGVFFNQILIVCAALIVAFIVGGFLKSKLPAPDVNQASSGLKDVAVGLGKARKLFLPTFFVVALATAAELSRYLNPLSPAGITQIALGLSIVFWIRRFVSVFIVNKFVIRFVNYIIVPAALLYTFGLLDETIAFLDSLAITVGSIKFSAYDLLRTFIFGGFLFWLGRASNSTGQKVIREQEDLDLRTKEIAAKFFEIGLFLAFSLLLLQVMGINLTALAVFGGAVGVGLGFGLQQIASNFISGIIILLDKSLTIGDYIELEDGRTGRLRELSMRSATLETYDGKDIMVPNESFITTSFTNWTHYNEKQRYSLNFFVSYDTDIPAMIDIVRAVVKSHPQVLSGEEISKAEIADAEIESFGETGINILVEYWMEGIDDGENRVGADLLLMIWMALKQHNIEIPFPRREVSILGDGQKPAQ